MIKQNGFVLKIMVIKQVKPVMKHIKPAKTRIQFGIMALYAHIPKTMTHNTVTTGPKAMNQI